jgi:hypothetical protein
MIAFIFPIPRPPRIHTSFPLDIAVVYKTLNDGIDNRPTIEAKMRPPVEEPSCKGLNGGEHVRHKRHAS